MKIELPIKNDGAPYTRIELERWIRENIYIPYKHTGLMKLASLYNIHNDCYATANTNLLIHFCLDRMRDQSGGSNEVVCVYEKMGLTTVPTRTRADTTGAKRYKIKLNGVEYTGTDTGKFMFEFELKLADFIRRGWAMMPGDGEGVNLEHVYSLTNTPIGTYLEPPKVKPFVAILPPPLPDQTISVPIQDPSKRAKVKRVDVSMEIANVKSDIQVQSEKLNRAVGKIDSLENRITNVEYNLSKIGAKLVQD